MADLVFTTAEGYQIDLSKRYYIRLVDVDTYRMPVTLAYDDSGVYPLTRFTSDSYRLDALDTTSPDFQGDEFSRIYTETNCAFYFEKANNGLFLRHASTGRYMCTFDGETATFADATFPKYTEEAKAVLGVRCLDRIPTPTSSVVIKLRGADRYLTWSAKTSDPVQKYWPYPAVFRQPDYIMKNSPSNTRYAIRLDTEFIKF